MQTAVDDRQVTRERDSDGDKADSQQSIAAERESLHSTHGECVAVRSLLGKAHSPRVQVFHSRTSTHTSSGMHTQRERIQSCEISDMTAVEPVPDPAPPVLAFKYRPTG